MGEFQKWLLQMSFEQGPEVSSHEAPKEVKKEDDLKTQEVEGDAYRSPESAQREEQIIFV